MSQAKKILAMILMLTLAVSMISGCGNSSAPASPQSSDSASVSQTPAAETPTTPEAAEEPLAIKHFYNFDWYDDNYIETAIGQELQRITNTKIEVIKAPTGDNQKLNLMIASNDLPDLITTDKFDPNIGKMIENDQIYALSDLIDQYAPEMIQNNEPEYFQYYNWTDGKQYYFPNFLVTNYDMQQPDYNTVSGGTGMSAIRSDVYEAIGKPDMSTPDGFFNALKDAKGMFPQLQGWYFGPFNKDLTFFKAMEFQGYLFPATQFGVRVYEADGGKVTSGVRSSKFLEFIKFMNKAYTNSLLVPESFADASDISEAKVAKGNYTVMSWDVLHLAEGNTIQDNPDAKWVPLPYLTDGKYFKDASGWCATLISKKTANPERLMKLVSFLASDEGRQLISWGIKGEHWDMVDVNGTQAPRYIGDWDALRVSDWGKFTKEGGFTTYFAFQDDYVHNKIVVKMPSEKTDYEKTIDDYLKPNVVSDIAVGLINPDGASPEGIIQTKLSELSKTYYPKMVMANDEAAAIAVYEEFLQKADATGLPQLEEYWTAQYALFN